MKNKNMSYRKGLVFGIIILLFIAAFGASNVPGISKRTDYDNYQNPILYDSTDYPIEKYTQIKINGI
ncbi:MAG: hypothetical protein JSU91_08290, partial [Thermoplasmatales archaeon]